MLILQAPKSHRPLLPLGSARLVHHGPEVATLNGKLAGRGESISSVCSESINSWCVLDSSFWERIALIVSLENKTAKGDRGRLFLMHAPTLLAER